MSEKYLAICDECGCEFDSENEEKYANELCPPCLEKWEEEERKDIQFQIDQSLGKT